MADEIKEAPASTSKPKSKAEKIKLKLIGAGSCNCGGIILKKNEIVELEALQAESFMNSGLFERL